MDFQPFPLFNFIGVNDNLTESLIYICLDVQDLRAHTEYQNGYFDQHPVIRNLWAALNEFNSEEKRAFLKFVTSCSKVCVVK